MDTRFWGPSGWRLLHLISFQTHHLPIQKVKIFFDHVAYILPCKYCRASFADYVCADPIPESSSDFSGWLYRIHNRVNGKLREQKLLTASDPKWDEIQKRYSEWIKAPCSVQRLVGWDFFYSVAYTTPGRTIASKPMPGAPPRKFLKTDALQNRWNILPRQMRIKYIQAWWDLIPDVLPFEEWRNAWKKIQSQIGPAPVSQGRHKVTAWLFKMECGICDALKETSQHTSFEGLCSELSVFSSGCGSSTRSKTCRAKKHAARKRLTQRRKKYVTN